MYYSYYATQAFANMESDHWDFWNKGKNGMRDFLVSRQDKDGSWDPKGDGHSVAGGASCKLHSPCCHFRSTTGMCRCIGLTRLQRNDARPRLK